ncbi:MAG: hypothetical protein E6G60_17440 [Actinobacteria bacterium]|nr:MAG: hypothetical protein E6G60_17440 [Actinomycetota bacterium]
MTDEPPTAGEGADVTEDGGDESTPSTAVAVEERPAEEEDETPGTDLDTRRAELEIAQAERRELIMSRLVLPFVIPIFAGLAGVLFVINLASIFLGSRDPGNVVIGGIVVVLILGVATLLSASPRMRTSSLAMVVGTGFFIILAGGLTVYGRAWNEGKGGPSGYVEPTGKPQSTLTVEALAAIKFNFPNGNNPLPAGVNEIDYTGAPGHTLVFDSNDPNLSKFELATPSGPKKAKVDLRPGKYTVYCSVDGHRAQGMQATITVTGG